MEENLALPWGQLPQGSTPAGDQGLDEAASAYLSELNAGVRVEV